MTVMIRGHIPFRAHFSIKNRIAPPLQKAKSFSKSRLAPKKPSHFQKAGAGFLAQKIAKCVNFETIYLTFMLS
jgi:hypothetical protein